MMRPNPQIAALMVMAGALVPGCKKRDCLSQSYEATVQIIQDFNAGRCRAIFEGDRREFDCPAGNLSGEVNGRSFELELSAQGLDYEFTRQRIRAQCGSQQAELLDRDQLRALEGRFKQALAQLEVD